MLIFENNSKKLYLFYVKIFQRLMHFISDLRLPDKTR